MFAAKLALTALLLAPAHATLRPPAPPAYQIHIGRCPVVPDDPPGIGQATFGCAYMNPASPQFGDIWLIDPYDRFTRQHELGHIYDAELLNPGERNRIDTILSRRRWDRERFANIYAQCRIGPSSPVRPISLDRARRACPVIARAAYRP